jgi:starch synthase
VANLARFQSRAGIRTIALLPLYRVAREVAGELRPLGEPFQVRLGERIETVQLWTLTAPPPGPLAVFVEHDSSFDRPRIYGDASGDYPDNLQRYSLFAMACAEAIPRLSQGPTLVHAHDWHAALTLTYLRTAGPDRPAPDRVATVLSVHNAGYQGHYPPAVLPSIGLPWELFHWRALEWYGQFNVLKAGLVCADEVVTVSPNHAKELRTAEGGFGLHEVFRWLGRRFTGILNGIDVDAWDPRTDPSIEARYSAADLEGKSVDKAALQRHYGLSIEARTPIFVMAARLVAQKGLDLVLAGSELFSLDAQFVFLGEGEPRIEAALRALARANPSTVAVDSRFTDQAEHRLMAGADALLMPCQYEPCGLTQMRSQRYGVPPIVRRVGGLADTVDDGITGIVFEPFDAAALSGATLRAVDCYHNPPEWRRMVRTGMDKDFSWQRSVESHLEVYRRAVARHWL